MEKKLVKCAVYSFIVGLVLMIIFVPRTTAYENGMGMYTTVTMPYADYFFMIVRYALIFASICVLVLFTVEVNKRREQPDPFLRFLVQWVIEPIQSFFVGFFGVIVVGCFCVIVIAILDWLIF
ncbi:hypothetical protein G3578_14870 [Brevibacillus sp. SYP-B805]|uniref:hypothetical protein n=1 Tax=Brevibacillus sp. SYP-B805 TaxID=1578199 RepID=UPI0013EB7796|nr:hypothetical protein [Brevibacillus sp. SYP-B805]NGQ96444.1 hypothetical protein [Brevibacillus sp. SYP-B805]